MTIGQDTYYKVTKSLPGAGRLIQVWVLHASCKPGDKTHRATVECFVGDMNIEMNTRLPSRDSDKNVRDPGIGGWKDVPDDVKEDFMDLVPDGTKILAGQGKNVIVEKTDNGPVAREVEPE